MTTIRRSALVPYSAEQMFDLVNDIEQYPRFLPGCVEAKVIDAGDEEMLGELCLAKAGIRQRFVTRNRLVRPRSITLTLVEGDFSRFHAHWDFEPLSDTDCKVSYYMDFALKSRLLGLAAEPMMVNSASKMVDAMVKRAREVYG